MGEGRNDRSGERQRSTSGIKSSSDSELAQVKGKGKSKGKGKQKAKAKERWPFRDGLTVDELARYRRRRVQGQPRDSLGPSSEEKGKDFVSEYRRAFHTSYEDLDKSNIVMQENIWPVKDKRPENTVRLEGSFENLRPSYREDFKEYANVELPVKHKGPGASLTLVDAEETMETETESSKFIAHTNAPRRPSLVRRDTSLKYDGEFYTDTETFSSYVAYEGQHRPELARRPTSLKMEGELDTMTEKCEKFIQWLNVSRPELMRVPTNLRLEGDFETSTENHDKYVPFVGARRPELLRRSTNLRLEGEANFVPEYVDVFRKHNIKERPQPLKPETHLKTGRDLFQATESAENFTNTRGKETQAMVKLDRDVELEEKRREKKEREKREDDMKMLVSRLEDLNGPPLEVPEYKDAYKNFPRERPKIAKPEDEIGRADGSKVSSPTHSRFSTKIDQDPEYKSKYLDYSRDRPIYRKPPLTLRPTLVSSGRSSAGFGKPVYEGRRFDPEPTSEVKSQYVPYGHVPRVETLKMPANLRLEGSLDLEPEYRTAYCAKRDYSSCNEPRMHRRRDRSSSASRRRENYWISNNNAEQFGRVNAEQDQNAFQVLNTRIHEENVVGKPPPGSRRDSRASQRPTQLDIADRSILKNRSPSPTYRLHVCNVDDEPRGFGRRGRSPSLQSSGRVNSGERAGQDEAVRPYSPSFGREKQVDNQSFVVLDNAVRDVNRNEGRRRRTADRNCNVDSLLPMSRDRPRTPTNWMPPWYDSTNTI